MQWLIGVKIGQIIWEIIFFSSPFFAQRQSHGISSLVEGRCSGGGGWKGGGGGEGTGYVSVSVLFSFVAAVQYAVTFNIELYCITSQCNGGIPNLETHKTTNYHLNAVTENRPPSLEIQTCHSAVNLHDCRFYQSDY